MDPEGAGTRSATALDYLGATNDAIAAGMPLVYAGLAVAQFGVGMGEQRRHMAPSQASLEWAGR